MNGHEFTPTPEKLPDTKPASAGGPPDPPPRPPKVTGRELLEPGEEGKVIFVSSYVELKDLAEALRLKPFKVVADLLLMRIFKHSEELIDFETAAIIARKHGFVAKRIL